MDWKTQYVSITGVYQRPSQGCSVITHRYPRSPRTLRL